jgi:predicted acylesterase/phospholipase RssA
MKKSTREGKTALVLAGGGLTGAVYEIGALRAIDDLLEDRTVNDFDIYVGTSAGALVAAFIANGLSPEEMLQVIDDTHPRAHTIERKHLFNLDWQYYLKWGLKLPGKLMEVGADYLRNLSDITFFDLLWSLSNALPAGLYDPSGLEKFVREGLNDLGLHNTFEDVPRQLYVIATDLDSGERAVFGQGHLQAPISQSIAASSALPMMYKPVKIGGKEYVDGGTRGNASIDLAIEQGASLVVCINPLVPFDNHPRDEDNRQGNANHLSEKGVQSIANQVFRIMLHSGLQYHIKQLRRAHPEVDIILIEPRPEDFKMFFYNIMRYSARLLVARHGFESVTLHLAKDYYQYKDVLARHGIQISRGRVIEELAEIAQSHDDPAVVREVLEARLAPCRKRSRNLAICELDRSLEDLDLALELFKSKSVTVA